MTLQTEYDFTLPQGLVDQDGTVHKRGVMRLATAADEILPQKDPRVQNNPAYQTILLLARVVRIGSLPPPSPGEYGVEPAVIEKLFVPDLAYLQELYRRINNGEPLGLSAKCPKCQETVVVSLSPGESLSQEAPKSRFDFTLPRGFVEQDGKLHKQGIMQLATAGDEILPQKDPRVQSNPAYLTIILLARVVTKLGTLPDVNPRVIEGLFVQDLAALQELYQNINGNGALSLKSKCPHCQQFLEVEVSPGES
jgi:phage FluMu protein Com